MHLVPPPAPAPPARPPVGVTMRTYRDTSRDRRLAVTVWYPAASGSVESDIGWDGIFPGRSAWDAPLRSGSRRLPVVLLSHGSGGDGANLAWLGEALASHGDVAVAVDHPGDRFGDVSVEGRFALWRRPADLTFVLSQLLADPVLGAHLDARRVGAAGHSSGASTVLMLGGVRLRPLDFLSYCGGPSAGVDCTLVRGVEPAKVADLGVAGGAYRDRRVRAVLALAPVMGPAFDARSVASVPVPVELVASPSDELVPFERNAAWLARRLPHAKLTPVPPAGHFVFMPVCSEPGRLVASQVCVDRAPEVERAAVHARTIRLALAFFDRALGRPGRPVRRRRAAPPAPNAAPVVPPAPAR